MPKKVSKIEKIKNFFFKAGLSLLILLIALIPTWLYLLAHNILNPEEALAKILLFGIALYFFGGLQIICLIFATVCIYFVVATK